jgi:hypothetical protein
MTEVWVVWRLSHPLLPGMRQIELITLDARNAERLAASSHALAAESFELDAPRGGSDG